MFKHFIRRIIEEVLDEYSTEPTALVPEKLITPDGVIQTFGDVELTNVEKALLTSYGNAGTLPQILKKWEFAMCAAAVNAQDPLRIAEVRGMVLMTQFIMKELTIHTKKKAVNRITGEEIASET